MDPTAFDALARSFHAAGTRRWLLRRLVASLSLLGVLAVVGEEEVGAERPLHRIQRRTQQRNRKQRNRKQRNNNNNGNNNNNNAGGGGGGVGAPNASCPPANICNNNQGQPICCQHFCLNGVCCPCDNVARCQQCVVNVGQNPPQASCQTYCPAGQVCTAAGCLAG